MNQLATSDVTHREQFLGRDQFRIGVIHRSAHSIGVSFATARVTPSI
jgi:hypothetical protein